ncbi:hypothetical protein AGABI1DRAFT_88010, partial [Agaricus bisporus var. burnettii JB137-S8]
MAENSNVAVVPNGHNAETKVQNTSKTPSPKLKVEPISKWTNNTSPPLNSSDHALSATSPILEFPGSYPYSPISLEPGPTFEEIKDTAKQYIHAAGQYVPSHEDVSKLAHNAGHTVREYFPNGVYMGLGPNSIQEAVPTSPIEESETTPHSGEGFVLINRGKRTQGDSEPQLAPANKPAPAPPEFSGATRTKLLIQESKHDKNSSHSVQNDQAS